MSDLQCAATILLAPHATAGLEARSLGRSLTEAHLALIYSSAAPPAVQTAEVVAAETGVPVVVRETLRDDTVLSAELETIADAHRGETVLVMAHAGSIRATVPALVGLADVSGSRPGCALVELAADADGWVLRSWADELGSVR